MKEVQSHQRKEIKREREREREEEDLFFPTNKGNNKQTKTK
jgi:hypothetical protein